jgi:hypothetical protein
MLRENGPLTTVEKVALVVGMLVAIGFMWPLRGYLTDDTYIHLQYARHLAEGRGLVFNVGERVYGCTSPLWVTLIADGIWLGLDGLVVAKLLGAVAGLATIPLFLQLMRRSLRTPALRAAATLAWSFHAWNLRWAASGMETPLAVALVLAGFVAFTEGRQWGVRPVRTGTLWALAALTRPEAVLLLVLWGVFLIADTNSRPGLRRLAFGIVPPVLIYGSWLLFARFFFGTFWPQTLSAKAAGGLGFEAQLDNLWRQVRIVGATDGTLAVLLVVALLVGGRRLWPRAITAQRMLPWVWVAAVPLLYLARGIPVLSRYLLPLLPVLAWLAWRAAEWWWVGETRDPRRMRLAAWLGGAIALLVIVQNVTVYRTAVVPHVRSFSAGFENSLGTWGRWFGENTRPDATIAAPDIGAIAWFSRRRVIDLAGLVTPQMVPLLEQRPQEDVVSDFGFAAFARPDYLIDRAEREDELREMSPWGRSLEPLGHASVPNLGIARPGERVYTFYRVHWAVYDSMRLAR